MEHVTILRSIYSILPKGMKFRVQLLVVLLFVTAIIDVMGVVSIMPYLALISDPDFANENLFTQRLYELTNSKNQAQFVVYLGICLILFINFAAILKAYTFYNVTKFNLECEGEISARLLEQHLRNAQSMNSEKAGSELSKEILTEAADMVHFLITPAITLLAQGFTLITILTAILIYDKSTSTALLISAFLIILVIKLTTSATLKRFGKEKSEANTKRYRMVSDAIGARQEIFMRSLSQTYYQRFRRIASTFSNLQTKILVLQQASRFAIEGLSFSAILVFILVTHEIDTGADIMSKITLFAVAAYKLMPAIQHVNESIGRIYSSNHISKNLTNQLGDHQNILTEEFVPKLQEPFKELRLKNVSYRPLASNSFTLEKVDLNLTIGQKIGLVGESGSGKSTLLRLIMGISQPTSGTIYYNGAEVKNLNSQWRSKITYLPQKISIIEGNFVDNILFDCDLGGRDYKKFDDALRVSFLEQVIEKKPRGLLTELTDSGTNISGGELQRIGIARAVYHNSEIIILDEVTSALDTDTEAIVMHRADEYFRNKLVVIVSHRPTILKNCDAIYQLSAKTVRKVSFEEI